MVTPSIAQCDRFNVSRANLSESGICFVGAPAAGAAAPCSPAPGIKQVHFCVCDLAMLNGPTSQSIAPPLFGVPVPSAFVRAQTWLI